MGVQWRRILTVQTPFIVCYTPAWGGSCRVAAQCHDIVLEYDAIRSETECYTQDRDADGKAGDALLWINGVP